MLHSDDLLQQVYPRRSSRMKMQRLALILYSLMVLTPLRSNAESENGTLFFSTQQLVAQIEFTEEPKLNIESAWTLRFAESQEDLKSKSLVEPDFDIEVKLWMSGCGPKGGHPSAPVKIQRISRGTYDISQAYFFMSGTWDIVIALRERDSKKLVDIVTKQVSIK